MSCRVLNRGVEQAVLNVLVDLARQRGISRLLGRYVPTEKNSLVRTHYESLGFTARAAEDGGIDWVLEVAGYRRRDTQVQIEFDDTGTRVPVPVEDGEPG